MWPERPDGDFQPLPRGNPPLESESRRPVWPAHSVPARHSAEAAAVALHPEFGVAAATAATQAPGAGCSMVREADSERPWRPWQRRRATMITGALNAALATALPACSHASRRRRIAATLGMRASAGTIQRRRGRGGKRRGSGTGRYTAETTPPEHVCRRHDSSAVGYRAQMDRNSASRSTVLS